VNRDRFEDDAFAAWCVAEKAAFDARESALAREYRAPEVADLRDAFYSYNPLRLVVALVALAIVALKGEVLGRTALFQRECRTMGAREARRQLAERFACRWRIRWWLWRYRVRRRGARIRGWRRGRDIQRDSTGFNGSVNGR